MDTHYRAFSEEFYRYMAKRAAWPREEVYYGWLRHKRLPSGKRYNALKHGDSVPEKYSTAFVELLLSNESARDKDLQRAKLVLSDFLRDRGVHSLTQIPQEGIVAHICDPVTVKPHQRVEREDLLRRGLGALADALSLMTSTNCVQACRSETPDVDLAVHWMYIRKGQCVSPDGPRLPHDQAAKMAEIHMQVDREQYQSIADRWHAFNPWTVIFAREGDLRTGMSIVLPLSDAAYDDIVNGRRATFELVSDDFTSPTPNLLIEAVAENPNLSSPDTANPAKSLLMALACQCRSLARAWDIAGVSAVRTLSFAGTAKNRDRLLESGFKPVGRTMAKMGLDLVEKIVSIANPSRHAFLDSLFLMARRDGAPPFIDNPRDTPRFSV